MSLKKCLGLLQMLLLVGAFSNAQASSQALRIHIQLSVDWEGDTLRLENLRAMQRFNREFPNYPVIHFLNAAYYTKDWDLSEQEVTRRIRMALKPNDELGLHIHSWKNLVEASGVEYRQGPSFWNQAVSIGRNGELGDDVPINIYNEDEIRKIIRFSRQTLEAQGLGPLESYRGGGWMSGPHVQRALLSEGIHIDSSAVPPELVERLYPNTRLAQINRQQWPEITQFSRPYRQSVSSTQEIMQFPNNLGLADYVDERQWLQIFRENVERALHNGDRDVYLHLGWHQESAVAYFEHGADGKMKLVRGNFLERVKKALRLVESEARAHQFEIRPVGFRGYIQARPRLECVDSLRGLLVVN